MVNWDELKILCASCKKCNLYKTRTNIVLGKGNINTNLMFVAEAPGRQEDLTGTPFVGNSGQLFDKILETVDITRDEIYLTNIVKCRPPENRNPTETEKQACLPYLRNQVALIHPKIIVCLGRVAAQTIIRSDFKIAKEHGNFFERKGYFLTATYHPSALLRDPSKKMSVWEDFKAIKLKFDELR